MKTVATILALFFSLTLQAQNTEKNYFKDAFKRDSLEVPPALAAYPVKGEVTVELETYSTIPHYKVEFFVYDAHGKLIYYNVMASRTMTTNLDKDYTAYMMYTGPWVLKERGKQMEGVISRQE